MQAIHHGVMVSSLLSWMFSLCFTPVLFGKLEWSPCDWWKHSGLSYRSEWLCPGPVYSNFWATAWHRTASSLETQPLLKAHSRGAALCPGSKQMGKADIMRASGSVVMASKLPFLRVQWKGAPLGQVGIFTWVIPSRPHELVKWAGRREGLGRNSNIS